MKPRQNKTKKPNRKGTELVMNSAVFQINKELLESRIRGLEWILEVENSKLLRSAATRELARVKEALRIMMIP